MSQKALISHDYPLRQGPAHGTPRWAATSSTLTRRPPQQLKNTWKTEYFKYKKMAVV